jgi:hypothetical protein
MLSTERATMLEIKPQLCYLYSSLQLRQLCNFISISNVVTIETLSKFRGKSRSYTVKYMTTS